MTQGLPRGLPRLRQRAAPHCSRAQRASRHSWSDSHAAHAYSPNLLAPAQLAVLPGMSHGWNKSSRFCTNFGWTLQLILLAGFTGIWLVRLYYGRCTIDDDIISDQDDEDLNGRAVERMNLTCINTKFILDTKLHKVLKCHVYIARSVSWMQVACITKYCESWNIASFLSLDDQVQYGVPVGSNAASTDKVRMTCSSCMNVLTGHEITRHEVNAPDSRDRVRVGGYSA